MDAGDARAQRRAACSPVFCYWPLCLSPLRLVLLPWKQLLRHAKSPFSRVRWDGCSINPSECASLPLPSRFGVSWPTYAAPIGVHVAGLDRTRRQRRMLAAALAVLLAPGELLLDLGYGRFARTGEKRGEAAGAVLAHVAVLELGLAQKPELLAADSAFLFLEKLVEESHGRLLSYALLSSSSMVGEEP